MTQHTHQTAPTQFVDAAGVRFAYRRFGKSGGVPLVFDIHTGDRWPRSDVGGDPVQQRGRSVVATSAAMSTIPHFNSRPPPERSRRTSNPPRRLPP